MLTFAVRIPRIMSDIRSAVGVVRPYSAIVSHANIASARLSEPV